MDVFKDHSLLLASWISMALKTSLMTVADFLDGVYNLESECERAR
jgi:hypothetical protein